MNSIMSGFDLVWSVLNHEHGCVNDLLSLSGGDESNWLELKSGMQVLPEDAKKGEKPEDLYWNIAKEIIAIANTSGGVIFIGIKDKTHEVVPLRDNDPRHIIQSNGVGLEDYRRQEIWERVWPEKKRWKSKNDTWTIESKVNSNLVVVCGCKYQNEDIAAILIRPAEPCIKVMKNGESEQLFHRAPGQVGQVKMIVGSDKMNTYEKQYREIETRDNAFNFERFINEINSKFDQNLENVLEPVSKSNWIEEMETKRQGYLKEICKRQEQATKDFKQILDQMKEILANNTNHFSENPTHLEEMYKLYAGQLSIGQMELERKSIKIMHEIDNEFMIFLQETQRSKQAELIETIALFKSSYFKQRETILQKTEYERAKVLQNTQISFSEMAKSAEIKEISPIFKEQSQDNCQKYESNKANNDEHSSESEDQHSTFGVLKKAGVSSGLLLLFSQFYLNISRLMEKTNRKQHHSFVSSNVPFMNMS